MDCRDEEPVANTHFLHKGEPVIVSLFEPFKKWEDGDEFACRYSIVGGSINLRGECVGYDSMQAIILSLATVGYLIEESDEIDSAAVDWPGGRLKFPSLDVS